ncbi:MAG: DedA family protein [Streptomyces sp.]
MLRRRLLRLTAVRTGIAIALENLFPPIPSEAILPLAGFAASTGRMIPVFRSLVSIPAGVERMPLPVFLTLTTLGSALWNTAFVLAGHALGANWTQVTDVVSAYSKVVLALAALAVVAFTAVRLLRRGRPSPTEVSGSS